MSAGALPAGFLRCPRAVSADRRAVRAEDHLGEDAEGDEAEEASHGAPGKCSGRLEMPVKSHVTMWLSRTCYNICWNI